MGFINHIDVGGAPFDIQSIFPMGTCATPAGTEVKQPVFSTDFEVREGASAVIKFTYANTYGDGTTTYPKLSVNGSNYPLRVKTGGYAGTGAWSNGQYLLLVFDGTAFVIM